MLTGCTTTVAPSSLVDLTLDVAKERAPASTTFLTYDVSVTVAHESPTYTDDGHDAAWTVIAACSTSGEPLQENGPNLAMAVVPNSLVTAQVRLNAKRGEYDRLLTECHRRTQPTRGTGA